MRPLSSLLSMYTNWRKLNKIIVTQSFIFLISCTVILPLTYFLFSNELFLFHIHLFPIRYDLDACDIQEKYPDLFQVNLDIEVEPRDRPSTKTPPWEGFQTKGLNPKILFSSRDEQQEILSKFGRWRSQTLGLEVFGLLCFSILFLTSSLLTSSPLEHVFKTLITTGKPELPRQPGSSAFYDSESPQPAQTPEGPNAAEPVSPVSTDSNANNFFQTLDWEGTCVLVIIFWL